MSAAAFQAGMTIGAARRTLAARLRAAAIDTPDLDARILVGEACALDLTGLARQTERALSVAEAENLSAYAARRLAGEPVARILARKEFWGLELHLNPDALVPRPDTETIVEAALAALGESARTRALRLLDLGTGSGAILLALLREWPLAIGIGTDIADGALACARANARALGLEPRATFLEADMTIASTDGMEGPFDLIISNPPYIRSAEIDALEIEVRAHDPRPALDGGPDGLVFYLAIAEAAARLLVPGGWLIVETGWDQTDAVSALIAGAGLVPESQPLRDLAGRARGVRAQFSCAKPGRSA